AIGGGRAVLVVDDIVRVAGGAGAGHAVEANADRVVAVEGVIEGRARGAAVQGGGGDRRRVARFRHRAGGGARGAEGDVRVDEVLEAGGVDERLRSGGLAGAGRPAGVLGLGLPG